LVAVEPKVKSLTGGDPITARFMRQDLFTYQPEFTLWCAGNRKPRFKGVDEAIGRRVLLVPFLQLIPASKRYPALPRKLEADWPAILCWMFDGCLGYLRDGLNPPASALAATEDYLDSEHVLGQWLEERCIVHPRAGWSSLTGLDADCVCGLGPAGTWQAEGQPWLRARSLPGARSAPSTLGRPLILVAAAIMPAESRSNARPKQRDYRQVFCRRADSELSCLNELAQSVRGR
jgi:hypothetical protein